MTPLEIMLGLALIVLLVVNTYLDKVLTRSRQEMLAMERAFVAVVKGKARAVIKNDVLHVYENQPTQGVNQ